MNLNRIVYVVEIARQGSISKAANSLLVAQSNLSRAVKELEDELDIAIFERSVKGMVLTPDGEEFVRSAKIILQQMEILEKRFRNKQQKIQSTSLSSIRSAYISDAVAMFSKELTNEKVEMFFNETNSSQVENNVALLNYNLGVIRCNAQTEESVYLGLKERDLEWIELAKFSYCLLINRDSPLMEKEKIYMRDLEDMLEISHADPVLSSMMATLRKEELAPAAKRHLYVIDRGSQIRILQENNRAFMWISPYSEDREKRLKLCQRTVEDGHYECKDLLIYRKNYILTDTDKMLIKYLQEKAAKIR